jgi:predicted Abi (CAAX) family protease
MLSVPSGTSSRGLRVSADQDGELVEAPRDPRSVEPGPVETLFAGLKKLPDFRGAVEALLMFLVVVAAGIWLAQSGALTLNPVQRSSVFLLSVSSFVVPALGEELVFRGWLRRGTPIAAVISLLAYIVWHPAQVWLNLPFGRPEFLDPRFLSVVSCLGLACTLSRVRSGSIWPSVIIHWGIVVVWLALYGGNNVGST